MTESTPPEPKSSKPEPEVKKPVKKGWSNPALRMMGIPRISLPSRNWCIFWCVVASIGGGIAYDKYEQAQIRKKWMNEVKYLGDEVYSNDRIPRKMTIFIAPPPNDFLDKSLKMFRKYIKPVLNAGAVDLELFSETRQGDIRSSVAEKIRQLRKDAIEERKKEEEHQKQLQYNKSWTAFFKDLLGKKSDDDNETKGEILVRRQDLYTPTELLGLYKIVEPLHVKRDDETNLISESVGGVVCVGRGAYKEYLAGIHEGLLGPLEKPDWLVQEEKKAEQEKQKEKEENANESTSQPEEEEEGKEGLKPVTQPFIKPGDYSGAELAPELNFHELIKNKKNIPVLFEQPVYVFPVPNLSGFVNFPKKIFRYFTKRELADDLGNKTTALVYNKSRKFEYKDTLLGKEEEADWPRKWVESGKERNSEWVQDVITDERITNRMKVFDPKLK
ncbi:uncharacterized protein PRCAT00004208001 [Priceomyces carsonii]|uniref:uncharacterized protein n=1 Tax=Priceomyces carsonii TaxID=28549 RepID=UPI002ED9B568|nr:unnamed protein product [Priceomyces carsonii]